MPLTRVRFVSSNHFKHEEAKEILSAVDVEVILTSIKIDELQTEDADQLVRDKLLKAYRKLGRPLFVEHTGLHLDNLGGLPGGLTQIFWDQLKADRFSELFGSEPKNKATARTSIAYCDGKRVHIFSGEIQGLIIDSPRGNRDFQWDCVFVPNGHTETFAEMGPARKNQISMRRIALDKFSGHLQAVEHE